MRVLASLSLPPTTDASLQERYQIWAQRWARQTLQGPFAILDTETTGLQDPHLVELACIDQNGQTLIDTLVHTNQAISPSALALHGIDHPQLKDAPSPQEAIKQLSLQEGPILIYNAEFDLNAILNSLGLSHYQEANPFKGPGVLEAWVDFGFGSMHLLCLMRYYAYFKGEYQSRGYPRYHRLGGGHRAKEDCLAALERLRYMA